MGHIHRCSKLWISEPLGTARRSRFRRLATCVTITPHPKGSLWPAVAVSDFGSVGLAFQPGIRVVGRDISHLQPVQSVVRAQKTLLLLLSLCLMACWLTLPALAQNDDVHLTPRENQEDRRDRGPGGISDPSLATHTKPIKKDVDLVLVPVTITDPMNRLVTGLEKENFLLTDNGQPQQIRHFSSEDAPISLGVIFDVSGSMADKIDKSRQAVVEFFRTANPQDEFFLITFSEKPEVAGRLHLVGRRHPEQAGLCDSKGRTALLDAIYLGMDRMRKAHYESKALLIISDGGDNHSRYTEGEIKSMVREADVQIYGIGLFDRRLQNAGGTRGPGAAQRSHGSYWWADICHRFAQRVGGRRYEDWHRAAQPICARIPSNQSSTRWQVAEDQGEAESSERPAAAACVRQNWILCTYGIDTASCHPTFLSVGTGALAQIGAGLNRANAAGMPPPQQQQPPQQASAPQQQARPPASLKHSDRTQTEGPAARSQCAESARRHGAGAAAGTGADIAEQRRFRLQEGSR